MKNINNGQEDDSSKPSSKPLYRVEQAVPFEQSLIWNLNHTFYSEEGINAWRDGPVPYLITSNSRVGKTYAELIFGFLKDLASQGKTKKKVYVLELGAGHGRLAYHTIKHLERLTAQILIDLPDYCYVLSDISDDSLNFYKEHRQFKALIEQGRIDVAFFDALKSDSLDLQISGKRIRKNDLGQPLIVLANYFFDSISTSLFQFNNGQLSSCTLALDSEEPVENLATSDLLGKLKLSYHTQKLAGPYFKDEKLDKIIESYRTKLKRSYLLFPHVGMQMLDRLKMLSSAGMLLISMDKGHHEIHDLENTPAPEMMTHGSMSFSVNYHALGLHCEESNGEAWFPGQSTFHVQMVCLLYLEDTSKFPDTRLAYQRYVEDFGPDDFDSVKKLVYAQSGKISTQDYIAIMRLSAYDSGLFLTLLPDLNRLIKRLTFNERQRIVQTLHQVWEMYFTLKEKKDLAFEIGGVLYALGAYEDALIFFDRSEQEFGNTPDMLYNKILAFYQLRMDKDFASSLANAKKEFPDFARFKKLETLDLNAP